MADKISQQARSDIMRRIKKKGTQPEKQAEAILREFGCRFRRYDVTLPGTPDLVLRREKKVIFVHGCFWHQHRGCKLARQPKSNLTYWIPKLARNKSRDAIIKRALTRAGWKHLTLWECELKSKQLDAVRARMQRFINAS